MTTLLGSLILLLIVVLLLGCIAYFIVSCWAIVDCAINSKLSNVHKTLWILVNLFVPVIGALAYCLLVTESKWLKRLNWLNMLFIIMLAISLIFGDLEKLNNVNGLN